MSDRSAGNTFFYILLAVVLIGLLTVALRDSGGLSGNIDKESENVRIGQLLTFSNEMQRAAQMILEAGASESDLRTATPTSTSATYGTISTTPSYQIFSSQGGSALYRLTSTTLNNGSPWYFSADRAMPQVGTSKADLVAFLPGITASACLAIDKKLGYSAIPSTTCSSGVTYFTGSYSGSPFTFSTAAFSVLPAQRFCVQCTDRSNDYVYFTTILAR